MAFTYSTARIPGVRYLHTLARTRGWPYVVAWAHRITGLLLVIYGCLHIQTGLIDLFIKRCQNPIAIAIHPRQQ